MKTKRNYVSPDAAQVGDTVIRCYAGEYVALTVTGRTPKVIRTDRGTFRWHYARMSWAETTGPHLVEPLEQFIRRIES